MGQGEIEAARDIRLFGLFRTAMGGTKDQAEAWLEARQTTLLVEPEARASGDDLRAAQRASLEALGIRVEE